MNLSLPVLVVALPSVSAMILALVPSWRTGTWVNAAAATLLFLLTCLLPWHPREHSFVLEAGPPETIMTLLTSFVAMTTSWFSSRYIAAAFAQRLIDPLRARIYHVAYQAFVATLLCALLSDNWPLTWLMLVASIAACAVLTGLPLTETALAAAWRMLLQCGAALMITLFGILALHMAAELNGLSLHWSELTQAHHLNPAALNLACIFLIVGCGALAGLLPLHSWLPDAAAEAAAPGAILLSTLLMNVPLLIILRVRIVAATSSSVTLLLLTLGLASLLLAACSVSARSEARRMVAFVGMSQAGVVVFAFGLGTPTTISAGLLLMTLLALARASVLQCDDLVPTQPAQWTRAASLAVLAALPLFALLLTAGATMGYAPWLMVPLAGGVLLVTWALAGGAAKPMPGSQIRAALTLVPIWLQLAIAVLLALATPSSVAIWFQALARAN